jgi:hypothetical protein
MEIRQYLQQDASIVRSLARPTPTIRPIALVFELQERRQSAFF